MRSNFIKNRKGQSLVETALVLPIIILVLTGIIDFGLLFNTYLQVSNASREGARIAAIGSTDAEIESAVNAVAAALDPDKLTVVISPEQEAGRESGDSVTVTVQYEYKMVTPLIGAIAPGPINLKTSTTMRCE